MLDPMLKVRDLQVYYGGIHALHGISMDIMEGSIVSIIGANGAGKSTLLRCLAGDKVYKSGNIEFQGKKLQKKSYDVASKGIRLVPEGRRIFANLTVYENLKLGATLETNSAEVRRRYEEVHELFPVLKERGSQMGGTLSGGEQQMLAIGRALMAKPKLLMLDEPSLGLAPKIIDEIFDKFMQIQKEFGVTILLVEQNAYIALEVAHEAYILSLGQITMRGTGQELLNDPKVQKAYMGVK